MYNIVMNSNIDFIPKQQGISVHSNKNSIILIWYDTKITDTMGKTAVKVFGVIKSGFSKMATMLPFI